MKIEELQELFEEKKCKYTEQHKPHFTEHVNPNGERYFVRNLRNYPNTFYAEIASQIQDIINRKFGCPISELISIYNLQHVINIQINYNYEEVNILGRLTPIDLIPTGQTIVVTLDDQSIMEFYI